MRGRLNNILVSALDEELYSWKSRPTSLDTRTAANRPDKLPLLLRFETKIQGEVEWKSETRTITGYSDYSLWYDGALEVGTNLIMVEAKRRGEAASGQHQLLVYMGKCNYQTMKHQPDGRSQCSSRPQTRGEIE